MIIDAIFSIGKTLWDVTLNLKGKKREKIERAAAFLNEISQILTDAADSLSEQQVPHGKCEELRDHADNFKKVMAGFVDEDKLDDLSKRLDESWEIERAYYELGQLQFNGNAEKQIIVLRKAGGYFRAVSAKILLDS